jgi:AcrR family transcriptional regulator
MGDPLFDTLFRPTAQQPGIASAPPVRSPGTRTRAGNAMDRTRTALLEGARRAVEASGTRITMAQVAAAAGVAKATLYNHFRTRAAVLAGLLTDEIETLVDELRERPLAEALAGAAAAVSEHPLRAALADLEPATLAALARFDVQSEGWRMVRTAVSELTRVAEYGGTDMVLRWLASFLVTPGTPAAIAADLDVLLTGLPTSPAAAVDIADEARPA